MKLPITKDWLEERAAAEGDLEIGAGRRLTKTMNLSAEEIAELERLAFEALPAWARTELASLHGEVARFRSERAYIIGHNDGWRDAMRQEVFQGTVDTDSPLEAAAREAGWALMEVVDEIDFRKREEVSDIASRVAKALLAVSDEQDEMARARVALADVANWINSLPIPTTGATRMLGIVRDALSATRGQP